MGYVHADVRTDLRKLRIDETKRLHGKRNRDTDMTGRK